MSDGTARNGTARAFVHPAAAPEQPEPEPQVTRSSAKERNRKRREKAERHRTTYRTTERNKAYHAHINITRNGGGAGTGGAQGQGGGAARGEQGTPGADFMSNEDIRAFSEHVRKAARNRAVERSMDAEQLQAVLRRIPDATGSLAGSRMRAWRVARPLKKIAAAEKVIARNAAALHATFEREFESELRRVGRARPAADRQPRPPFQWH